MSYFWLFSIESIHPCYSSWWTTIVMSHFPLDATPRVTLYLLYHDIIPGGGYPERSVV